MQLCSCAVKVKIFNYETAKLQNCKTAKLLFFEYSFNFIECDPEAFNHCFV
jgi:hypothetical protein